MQCSLSVALECLKQVNYACPDFDRFVPVKITKSCLRLNWLLKCNRDTFTFQ